MRKPDPEFADIYSVDTRVTIRDAHEARRPVGVVRADPHIVTVLGRTTQLHAFDSAHCVMSAIDPRCRLDKVGMFSLRFKHSIPKAAFADERKCDYCGPLSASEAAALKELWDSQFYV